MNNEQLAMPARNLTYCPTVSYPLYPNPYTLNFAFSAKERDTETGLSVTSLRSVSSSSLNQTRTSSVWYSLVRRFGSRYYSSDLSIWLSIDPMSGRYLRDVYAQIDILLKRQNFSILRTTSHEIGHALGCGEFFPNPIEIVDYGLMVTGGEGEQIRGDYISSMLNHVGFNCPNNESEPTSKCLVVVRGNIPSRQGRVQKKN